MIYKAMTLGEKYVKRNVANQMTSQYNKKNSEILHEQHIQSKSVTQTSTIGSFKRRVDKTKIYNEKYNEIGEKVLTEAIYTIYDKALPLDEDFKDTYKENIRQIVNENIKQIIQENGSVDKFLNNISSKSNFLQLLTEKAKEKIEEKTSEETDKEVKKAKPKKSKEDDTKDDKKLKEDDDSIVNDIEDDDEEDIRLDLKSMDIDEACNVIKDKVIKVVADEEEESLKQQEILEDIKNAKALGESVHFKNNINLTKNSLFKSLMINNYKDILQESVNGNDTIYSYKVDDQIKVDMDMVLVESILKYTLLETFYTLKIKDYSKRDLENIAKTM